MNASETIQQQHATIAQAIELLQKELDSMTDSVNPDSANWGDVSEYAKAASLANEIIASYEDS